MKKVLFPLIGALVLSFSAAFAAETKDAAKDKASCCDEQGSCCGSDAQKKDSKDAKPSADKTAEPKKS